MPISLLKLLIFNRPPHRLQATSHSSPPPVLRLPLDAQPSQYPSNSRPLHLLRFRLRSCEGFQSMGSRFALFCSWHPDSVLQSVKSLQRYALLELNLLASTAKRSSIFQKLKIKGMKKTTGGFDLTIQARSSTELAKKFRQVKQEKADFLHKRLRDNNKKNIQTVDDMLDQNMAKNPPPMKFQPEKTSSILQHSNLNQVQHVKKNKRCPSMLIDDFVGVYEVSREERNQSVQIQPPLKVNQNQPPVKVNQNPPPSTELTGRNELLQVNGAINQGGEVEEPNKETGAIIKKTCGKTMCKNVHAKTLEEREEVILNEHGQPIGPTDRVVSDLALFLGTLARNSTFCPLIYTSWTAMPSENIERVWSYTQSKFILPEEANNWVKITVRDAWRRYKHMIKKNHFLKYSNMTDRIKNRPLKMPESQFRQLCSFWSLETVQSISKRNTLSRAAQKWRHRMGPKTFAIIRERMRSKENRDPTQAEVFIETRKRVNGKELDLETNNAISQLQDIMNNEESNVEAFKAVFGKEHPGSVRCFGKGISQTALKRKEEITALKKVHNEEVALLNAKMQNVEDTLHNLKSVLKTMLQQNNPTGIDVESLENLLGSSPGDANSAQNRVGQPHAHSSTSTHVPNYGEKILNVGVTNEELPYDDHIP